jgi:Fe-S oxidoreductase
MEQADLRKLEAQCVQEEPPFCTAACPLHVNARAFCSLMGQGDWDKAWAVLARTLPLPGVLSRLCHGPCMEACVRSAKGGAINIPALERFCAEQGGRAARTIPMPAKGKRVCVLGGGLAGLSAAWDLVRKGIRVVLHSERPGLDLAREGASPLPAGVLDAELERMARLGADFQAPVAMTAESLQALLEEFDAVIVDCAEQDIEGLGLGEPDTMTLGTNMPGVFVAGQCDEHVFQAASGRKAALSAERFMQGASMVAGREREAPYPSKLFTNVDDVAEVAPEPVPEQGYDAEQARAEGLRCIRCECLECVKHCEYLARFGSYPKVYARQIYNNQSIVMGTRQANTLINSCTMCGLCEELCPGDFSMEDLCLQARRELVEQGNMPPSAHEFALRDMHFANGPDCALARHAPGEKTSTHLFFPGCQLTASRPAAVRAAYDHLRAHIPAMGIMLRCCGAPAHWAGRTREYERSMDELRSQWESLGRPAIVCACPTCQGMLQNALPAAAVVDLWQVLQGAGVPESVKGADMELTVHDPCTTRHEPEIRQQARGLLQSVGVRVREVDMSGNLTECCGFGGLLAEANPELGADVAKRRADSLPGELVTYCAMCRDMLAKGGARISHVLDILFPDPSAGDLAARPAPGYSRRRENRAHLRESLLTDLWREPGDPPKPYEELAVSFTEACLAIMEQRRILESDVRKTLLRARETGRRLVHAQSGRCRAVFRPVAVTYWVEFEETGDGYLVHNAWCHRMRVAGGAA